MSSIGKILQLLKNIVKRTCNVVEGLNIFDDVVNRDHLLFEIEFSIFGGDIVEVVDLPEAAANACTVELAESFFSGYSKLDCEPVDRTYLGNLTVGGPQTQLADLLANVTDYWIREHRNVAHIFVNNIWFGGVLRTGGVADVLGAGEGPEGQKVEELSQG